MTAWYNECDPYAAQWLRNLIAAGLIAPGEVDDRRIEEVKPDDLRGYVQCHWFAGIAGWSHALRLAGWPDDRPVWTGSCPCQPFSAAGKGKATEDERHLWPVWFELIRACRPEWILGEQVEAAIGWGWLDLVCDDLEAEGYACRAAVLPACGVGAPHIRNRLWFVADAQGDDRRLPDQSGDGRQDPELFGRGETRLMGDAVGPRLEERAGERRHDGAECAAAERTGSPWSDLEWLPCLDGKARPTKPGIFPLVDGISYRMGAGGPFEGKSRVGMLRCAGNAIVPPLAAEFIKAVM